MCTKTSAAPHRASSSASSCTTTERLPTLSAQKARLAVGPGRVVEEGPDGPRPATPSGGFGLHHVGAQAGEQAAAVVGRLVGQLDDPDAVERPGRRPVPRRPSALLIGSAPAGRRARPSAVGDVEPEDLAQHGRGVLAQAGAGRGRSRPPVCGAVADMRKGTPSRGSGRHLGVAQHGEVAPRRQLRVALEAVGGVLHGAGRAPPPPAGGA